MQTDHSIPRLLLSKKEASVALSVSVRTIENLIFRKELATRKVGRRTLIPMRSLEDFARRDHLMHSKDVNAVLVRRTTDGE